MENVAPAPKKEVAAQEVEHTHNLPTYVPPTDIFETPQGLVVVADMPGVDESSVNVHLEKGILTINGRTASEPLPGYRLAYAEYEPGVYERSFSLSEEIDVDKIEASMKNGVLTVTLPKTEQAKPRAIAIKVEK